MNKENNRSAAGLRRSAIAERIRLREEWSELKGTSDAPEDKNKTNVLRKRNLYKNTAKKQNYTETLQNIKKYVNGTEFSKTMQANSEVLHGVVALVDVGAEMRALALRAALTALGATVVPTWSPIVTHLVWSQAGSVGTRARARALACRLVSPLWVEACAASAARLPERAFPAAARASDLPSPKTLRQLLKKAEMENIPLLELLSDKEEERENRPARLRLSSDTDRDTSADTSRDTSADTSRDTSKNTSKDISGDSTIDVESRVNTAPRRALPNSSVGSPRPTKSRRKLFTQKEAEVMRKSDEESDAETPGEKRNKIAAVTQRDRKELARAERMARRLVGACAAPAAQRVHCVSAEIKPRIVLTGMDRAERHAVCGAIRKLNGRVQSHVNRRTTHVLLGSCRSDSPERNCSGVTALNITNTCSKNTRTSPRTKTAINSLKNNTINNITVSSTNNKNTSPKSSVENNVISTGNEMRVVHRSELQKARTLNALLGAARGCRVLNAQWALDSLANNTWLHHHGYEVPHLKKISQKARIERTVLSKLRSEYGYDVFYGMKVRVTPNAEQKDAAIQLLTLCGAAVQNGGRSVEQNGGLTQIGGKSVEQNGGLSQNGGQEFDLTVGVRNGEVSSKWVFDSVAAARMRTTRRYIVNRHLTQNTQDSVI